ncbi:MAG: LamG-like jellyroll fold domain-containing protein [Nanoarchaeota archaeon]|nr:LamG-like jellyroll fold domain-containing protein [Nanoarchaeota archaeon]
MKKQILLKENINLLLGILFIVFALVVISAVAPSVKFTSPTPNNGSFLAINNIFINVSANETNSELRNITFYLFNSTGSLNTSFTYNLSLTVNLLNNTYGIVEGISATSQHSAGVYLINEIRDNLIGFGGASTDGWISTELGGGTTNQNITINFTSPQIFDTIDIFVGYPSDSLTSSVNNTNVYVSDDYSSWTKIVSAKSLFGALPLAGQFDTINFTEQNKRYLRLEFKDNWGQVSYMSTAEIRVYKNKTNLANLSSTIVTATSTAVGSINLTRDQAKTLGSADNDRWYAGTGVGGVFNVNITWNFGSVKRVNSLEWFVGSGNGNRMPQNYSILVSSDDSSYTEISNGTFVGGADIAGRINFSEQNTQYLKIWVKTGYDTTYLIASEIEIIEASNVSYTHNFTGLSDGLYKYNTTAYDIFKFAGSSETRNVTIDTTKPLLEFVSPTPANNSGVSNEFQINVSITELYLANVTYNWNGTNFSYGENFTLFTPPGLTNGLVLMMNLDNESAYGENSTHVFDFSGNGNNGTAVGGAFANSSGKYGGAYTFDGSNDFINVSDINALDGITQMTVSAWIYNDALAIDKAIIAKWDFSTQGSWGFQTGAAASDELRVYIAPLIDDAGSAQGETTDANLAANRWYNTVFVYDGGLAAADRLKIYVDGTLKTTTISGTIPTSLTSATSTVKIGKFGGTLERYWDGNIDEVMIWNRSLSANEVKQIYFTNLRKNNTDEYFKFDNSSTKGNFTSKIRSSDGQTWNFLINQTGLTQGNSYTYYVYTNDKAGNTNKTATRTIPGNSAPTFISIVHSPTTLENLDPNVLINVTVNISDTDSNFDTAFLQWKNTSADWGNATNVTMINSTAKGAYTILNASFTPTYEANYSYRIWANDTSGSSGTSSVTNVSVFWDCTWTATSDLGSTAGWDENKRVGNIILNNTGDSSHSTGCSLDFRLTYDLSEGRIYFDNVYYKPSSTYTLSAKSSQNISVNATFLSETKSEDVIISTSELLSRTNVSQRNTTATVVSNQAGPYLFQKITSNPESVYLTAGNFSLEAYVRNLMGSTTINANNTAYNVTFNWTLPSGITNVSGTFKTNFTNITDSDLHYNNINASFSSLASMTSGVKTFYIYATGVNKTGNAIKEADGTTLLKKSVNITFLCYSTSDSVCVTACGSTNDPDCTASSPTSSSGGGGGGGGAGNRISTITGKSTAEYELVRGQEQSFELIIENQYIGYLENLEISVKGIRQDLIKIIPDKIEKIEAGKSKDIVIEIISPAYFTEGHYDLEFLITGNLITEEEKRPYLGRMNVDLFIIDIPRKEAESMLKESSKMFEQMNNSNMSLKKISGFYISLQESFEDRKFSEVKKSYDEIKTVYDNAFGSLELLEWLKKQIKKAEKNGISVIETKKLMYLGEATFERGDYESSIKRLEEARLTYALETKGEFNLFYAIKNNPLESTGILFAAVLFGFSSSLVARYTLYRRKLKNLEEEEKLLLELMKTVQRETFENSHFSMGAYREAMFQYETKLSEVIKDKIETETKLASLFKIKGRESALKGEKEKLYNLVKELQMDYLQKGKIETRVYTNLLKIYSTRIVEIEEKLVYLEAKHTLHKNFPLKKLKLGWWGL